MCVYVHVGTHTQSHSYAQRDWICTYRNVCIVHTFVEWQTYLPLSPTSSLACVPEITRGGAQHIITSCRMLACVYVALGERAHVSAHACSYGRLKRNNTMVRRVYHHMSPNVVSKNASNVGCE